MALTYENKKDLAELLSIVLEDDEYVYHIHKINDKTAKLAEEMMNDLIFCNRATTIIFNSIRCVPKSPNVVGWLIGCLPAVKAVFKAYKDELQANLICHTHLIANYRSEMKLTLLY